MCHRGRGAPDRPGTRPAEVRTTLLQCPPRLPFGRLRRAVAEAGYGDVRQSAPASARGPKVTWCRPLSALLLSVPLLLGCSGMREKRWAERNARMEQCRARWTHELQKDTAMVRVIYFQATFPFDLVVFPNFIIGTDAKGDTIGLVDRETPAATELADTIRFVPSEWTPAEMDSIRPAYQVFERKELNALYCAVKRVYHGRID